MYSLPMLPPSIDYNSIIKELTSALFSVGTLRGLLNNIQNPMLLTTPLMNNEAVLSSRIEGTQATLQDVYEYESNDTINESDAKIHDIHEIMQYRDAMQYATERLNNGDPLTINLVRDIHGILMRSVRGANRDPGEFRRTEVFIGPLGCSREEATYVPPPANEIMPLLSNWEEFIHDDSIEDFIRIGIAHYQFEAIHPFLDGNGRVGRLLIPLMFMPKYLPFPALYVSSALEEHKEEYYTRLNNVTCKGDWVGWLRYFMLAVSLQADATSMNLLQIQKLYNDMKSEMVDVRSGYGFVVLDTLFKIPVLTAKRLQKEMPNVSGQTVYNLLNKFVESGFLSHNGARRNRRYYFNALLDILKV